MPYGSQSGAVVESHIMTMSSKDGWEPLNWPFPSFFASLHSTWVKPGPQLLGVALPLPSYPVEYSMNSAFRATVMV